MEALWSVTVKDRIWNRGKLSKQDAPLPIVVLMRAGRMAGTVLAFISQQVELIQEWTS